MNTPFIIRGLKMTTFKEYRDEINSTFSRNTRRGFVDYSHCRRLGVDMANLMVDATKELAGRGEYKELFDLTNKGFLKWGKTNKDDSAGETQDFVYFVTKAWDMVYESNDARIPHAKMYNWFEGHINGSVIDYMEDPLYDYMIQHFNEPELLERKYAFLAGKIEEELGKEESYNIDTLRRYQLSVMADLKKPIEEIREYAKSIEPFYVKKTLAEIEQRYGNMDAVIAIYKELAEDEDRRGWARDNWHLKLMEIYKSMGDEENYRNELISAMAINIGNKELWNEYKQWFTVEDWPNVCEKLWSGIKMADTRAFPWYELEGRYDLIMSGIEASGEVDGLKSYEKKLKALYPERCLKVLADYTDYLADQSKNRNNYKRVARYLRWIQRYPGGNEKAAEIAAGYRIKYKLRSAMMEEIAEF